MIDIFNEDADLEIEEESEEITEQKSHSQDEGEYIRINLGSDEEDMRKCLAEYNKLYLRYSNILNWDVRQIYNASSKDIPIYIWRKFLLDSRIQQWIRDEQYIKMQAKRNELLDKVGDNNSTATVQALSAIMKATEEEEDRLEDNKVYIYSFIPLTSEEERLNNAQTLKAIPDEIRAGLQHINSKSSNK